MDTGKLLKVIAWFHAPSNCVYLASLNKPVTMVSKSVNKESTLVAITDSNEKGSCFSNAIRGYIVYVICPVCSNAYSMHVHTMT